MASKDWIPLRTEIITENPKLPIRSDQGPEDVQVECLSNQLLGSILRQIPSTGSSVPIFVQSDKADQVIKQTLRLLAPWMCMTTGRGDLDPNEWKLAHGIELHLAFDIEGLESFDDLTEDQHSWFCLAQCSLPEGYPSNTNPKPRCLFIFENLESAAAYKSFVVDRQLTEHNIVICTTKTLAPSAKLGFVVM